MSTDTGSDDGSVTADGIDDLEAKIEETRHHLAETVDALSAKTDVKARASAKADELKGRAQDAVTDDRGDLRPVVPAGAAVAAVVVVGLVVLVVRRRRRRP